MLFNILALISVLICLSLLKRFAAIFPSLMACIIRWKESVNLEASVKLSNDRDKLAFAMLLPFCLTADRFHLSSVPPPTLQMIFGSCNNCTTEG